MEQTDDNPLDWGPILKRFIRRLLALGENRLELLSVEVQEGRDRLIQDFLLALAVAGFAMIALLAGSAALGVSGGALRGMDATTIGVGIAHSF